ncbi:hypothetical protein [Lacunimicrobium album]
MKDALQKDLLFRHLSSQGAFAVPEVPVFCGEGQHGNRKLITDVDVLAIRPSVDLKWEFVLGDCKTLKGQSPANRVLWLKGLMDHFNATAGFIVLQRNKGNEIEADHKLFASRLGIILLDESEFQKYDSALVFPTGSSTFPFGAAEYLSLMELPKRYPRLQGFVSYVSRDAWNQREFTLILRGILGHGKSIGKEVDPRKIEHLVLALEGAAVFAVALSACTGRIFNQYIQPETENELENALKVIIWGGNEQYEFISRLRGDLLKAKGKAEFDSNGLALPRWPDFVHLVRSILEHPKIAFRIPLLIRSAAFDLMLGRPVVADSTTGDLLMLKICMLVVRYFARSSDFPAETVEFLVSIFARRQSEILHGESAKQLKLPLTS